MEDPIVMKYCSGSCAHENIHCACTSVVEEFKMFICRYSKQSGLSKTIGHILPKYLGLIAFMA